MRAKETKPTTQTPAVAEADANAEEGQGSRHGHGFRRIDGKDPKTIVDAAHAAAMEGVLAQERDRFEWIGLAVQAHRVSIAGTEAQVGFGNLLHQRDRRRFGGGSSSPGVMDRLALTK